MHLTFSPALRQVTTISLLPPFRPDDDAFHDLKFRATFNSREALDQAMRDNIRVEMWTDLPAPEGVHGWHALAFEHLTNTSRIASSNIVYDMSLAPNLGEIDEKLGSSVYLDVKLPSSSLIGERHQFSFTYRLVYPDGSIKWLGAYGQNGTIVIEKKDIRLNLSQDIRVDSDSFVTLPAHTKEIGKLNLDIQWSSCAISLDGHPTLSEDHTTSMSPAVILSPHPRDGQFFVAIRPIIFHALNGALVSISSAGDIIVAPCDNATGELRIVDATTLPLLPGSPFLAHKNTQVLSYDDQAGFVLVSSRDDRAEFALPVRLSFIPLRTDAHHRSKLSQSITVSPRDLSPVLSPTEKEFVLHHPTLNSVFSFSLSSPALTVSVPLEGDQLILAPLHTIPTQGDEDNDDCWTAAFLSPHSSPQATIEVYDDPASALPTPPPSPPAQMTTLSYARFEIPEVPNAEEIHHPDPPVPETTSDQSADSKPEPVDTAQSEGHGRPPRFRFGIRAWIEFLFRTFFGRLFGIIGFLPTALIGWGKGSTGVKDVKEKQPVQPPSEKPEPQPVIAPMPAEQLPTKSSPPASPMAPVVDDEAGQGPVVDEEQDQKKQKTTPSPLLNFPISRRRYFSTQFASADSSVVFLRPPHNKPDLPPSTVLFASNGKSILPSFRRIPKSSFYSVNFDGGIEGGKIDISID